MLRVFPIHRDNINIMKSISFKGTMSDRCEKFWLTEMCATSTGRVIRLKKKEVKKINVVLKKSRFRSC